MRKQKFEVTINIPDGYTANEVRAYMRDAISSWSGQFHPDDPLFGHFYGPGPKYNPRNLTIKPIKE